MIKEPMLTDKQIIESMLKEKSYSIGDAYGLSILIKKKWLKTMALSV